LLFGVLHHLNASCPTLKRVPNLNQTSVSILTPFMVPKSQAFDALFGKVFVACSIFFHEIRPTVLKTIELNRESCIGAVKIQNVLSQCVLPSKFEADKSMIAERPPKFPFFLRLLAAKIARDLLHTHKGKMGNPRQ
jgi:hypothetical protein